MMSAAALLAQTPNPSDADVEALRFDQSVPLRHLRADQGGDHAGRSVTDTRELLSRALPYPAIGRF